MDASYKHVLQYTLLTLNYFVNAHRVNIYVNYV